MIVCLADQMWPGGPKVEQIGGFYVAQSFSVLRFWLCYLMIVFLLKTKQGFLLFALSNKGMEEISCQSDSWRMSTLCSCFLDMDYITLMFMYCCVRFSFFFFFKLYLLGATAGVHCESVVSTVSTHAYVGFLKVLCFAPTVQRPEDQVNCWDTFWSRTGKSERM